MLINFSNHPSVYWGDKQMEAARIYGELKDIPFPAIKPEADEIYIKSMAEHYYEQLLAYAKDHHLTVHIMGEMTFVYRVVSLLKEQGITCIASTTDRNTEFISDNKKISDFHFVRFRKY